MTIALKDIKGLMVEKKICQGCDGEYSSSTIKNGDYVSCCPDGLYYEHEYNEAVQIQGERKIGLNRENLAEVINNALMKRNELKDKMFANVSKRPKLPLLHEFIADAIIANESTLIEYKQD